MHADKRDPGGDLAVSFLSGTEGGGCKRSSLFWQRMITETQRVRSLVHGGRCPSCTSSSPPCSLLTLKAEDSLTWLLPHDPSLLHVWYGKTTTSSLSCRVPQGSDTAGASHSWSPDISRWCVTVLHAKKASWKRLSRILTLWHRTLKFHLMVPPLQMWLHCAHGSVGADKRYPCPLGLKEVLKSAACLSSP